MVHVLTGPDHLSALATLSAVSDPWTAFFLGARWGMGHSTGLLLVGLILIVRDSTRDENDPRAIVVPEILSVVFESAVGVFMIVLGIYGIRRAVWKKNESVEEIGRDDSDLDQASQGHILDAEDIGVEGERANENNHSRNDEEAHVDSTNDVEEEMHEDAANDMAVEPQQSPSSSDVEDVEAQSLIGLGHPSHCMGRLFDSCRQLSVQTLAVLIGIIHGLAGPAGVLAVIPAVKLHDWVLATLYLSSFCVSSTLTMGCFAGIYGTCSRGIGKRTQRDFQIHLFSSSLSILVGVTWLVLSATGKMEDVFP